MIQKNTLAVLAQPTSNNLCYSQTHEEQLLQIIYEAFQPQGCCL
jgi:hypothetical protein